MPRPNLDAQRRTSRTPPKEQPEPATKRKQAPAGSGTDGAAPAVAGPPRRVKRKRSGGGKRR
jgi:hypothetical protein